MALGNSNGVISKRKGSYKQQQKMKLYKQPVGLTTTFDGIYYAKCHLRTGLTVDATTTNSSMGIHWGINGISGANDMYIDDSPEFFTLVKKFQQWKLVGLKVTITPIVQVTGAGGSGLVDIVVASDTVSGINSVAVTDIQLTKYPDYKDYSTEKSISRYYRAGKMYKGKGYEWLVGLSSTLPTSYYPDATTVVRLHSFGYAATNGIGMIDACWYVAFKGWSY